MLKISKKVDYNEFEEFKKYFPIFAHFAKNIAPQSRKNRDFGSFLRKSGQKKVKYRQNLNNMPLPDYAYHYLALVYHIINILYQIPMFIKHSPVKFSRHRKG